MLSEIYQTEKDKYHVIFFYGESKTKTNKNELTDRDNRLMAARGSLVEPQLRDA